MILLLFATQSAPAPSYPTAYAFLWRNNMNLTRKVSTTTYPIVFSMVDATDHISGKTGLTPTVTISKNGGSFGAVTGAVSELGGGLYALAGNATDRNTLGELWIHAEGTGSDNTDIKCDIVAHDPYGDINEILTDTAVTIPGLFAAIQGAGWSDETLVAIMAKIEEGSIDEAAIRSALGLANPNLDTQLSGLDAAIDTISDDMATVEDIQDGLATTLHAQEIEDKVDLILADTNEIQAELADGGRTDLLIDAIKLKTDLIPATPAQAGEYTAAIDAVDAKVSAIDTDTVMSFMIDGFTFEQIVQIMASVLAGKLTRSGDTLTFRDLADTVNRVVAETDANKQRTTMTYAVV